jgi:hypothetical protein
MPVAARPDVLAAVVDQLRASNDITTLTSTRITARAQPSWSGMPTYAVIVRPAGGPATPSGLPILVSRVDVFCYGATEAQSAALWRQLDAVFCPSQEGLTQFVQDDVRVGNVRRESLPISGVEPDTGWPRTACSYLVTWMGISV